MLDIRVVVSLLLLLSGLAAIAPSTVRADDHHARLGSAPPPLFAPQPPLLVPAPPVTTLTAGSQPLPERGLAPSARAQQIAETAVRYLGARYTWGGTSPVTGFDCSGFVRYIHEKVGVTMSRELPGQAAAGRGVGMAELAPGDLVLFANTYKPGLSHSGIYLRDGRFISALDERRGVVVSDIHDNYWHPRFVGGRRVA
jgi:cell wall-associated NlpC family hydrolase